MAQPSAVTDTTLEHALSFYAGMVAHILTRPQRWLGLDHDPPPTAKFPVRFLDAARDRAFGDLNPASSLWSQLPLQERIDWWLRRIAVSAGTAAAAPHLAGVFAARIPLQAALSASAAGLAVCATAREHGVTAAHDWVPLLGRVLFDRNITTVPPIPPAAETEQQLDGNDHIVTSPFPVSQASGGRAGGSGRAFDSLWNLARTLTGIGGLLDQRPRGGFVTRTIARVPVVGVAGGWLDERGAIRKASRRTTQLLTHS